MSRAALVMLIVMAGLVPIWGCGPTSPGLAGANTGALEARIVKLEKEFKAVEAARDAATARANDFESRWKLEAARAVSAIRERDELQTSLKSRVAEKEVVQTQLDGVRKGLREILGQMEPSGNPTAAR